MTEMPDINEVRRQRNLYRKRLDLALEALKNAERRFELLSVKRDRNDIDPEVGQKEIQVTIGKIQMEEIN